MIYSEVILFFFHLPMAVAEVVEAVLGDWRFAVLFVVEMQHKRR